MHNAQISLARSYGNNLVSIPQAARKISLVDNMNVNTTIQPVSQDYYFYVIVSPLAASSSDFKASFKFSFYKYYQGYQKEQDAKQHNSTKNTNSSSNSTTTNASQIPPGLSPSELKAFLKQKEREAYLKKFREHLPENTGHPRVN